MTLLRYILTVAVIALVCAGTGAAAWWLVTAPRPEAKKVSPPAPASVPRPLKEDQVNAFTLDTKSTPETVDLAGAAVPVGGTVLANAITLPPAALGRLDLRTGVVEEKFVPRRRTYGGEVMVPPGQTVIVSAPLGGTLQAPPDGMPLPGRTLAQGQPVLRLAPLLSPEARVTMATAKIDADGQVKTAQTQLDAAQITLDRVKRVFQAEAGSKRAVDDAQAAYDLARKALEAAAARRDLLEKVVGELEKGTSSPLSIESPAAGLLRNVSALPGQNVHAGAALFEVVDLDRVWVRVPVYVGDRAAVDGEADALVSDLSARPGLEPEGPPGKVRKTLGLPAAPAIAPPSANAAAGTVDLFYGLDNRTAKYSPGQRVGVSLSLKGEGKSLTVPWSAVVLDIYGGTWVYEQTGERSYVRRPVAVRYVAGDTAVLASGPRAGTKVVTAGAAELFGAETGFSK
jgi:membrane fusion protein, heavy metal efflux system